MGNLDNTKKIVKQNKETLFRRGRGKTVVAKDCMLEQDTSDLLPGS